MRCGVSSIIAVVLVLVISALAAIVACGGETTPTTNDQSAQERLLGWLPVNTTGFVFANVEAAQQRTAFQRAVDARIDELISLTGEVFDEELIRSAEVKYAVLGFNQEEGRDHQIELWEGDFQPLLEALEQAGADGASYETEIYRGIKIYGFQRFTLFYLADANPTTLVMGFSVERVKETIDRVMDGGEVPKILPDVFGDLNQADFLYAVPVRQASQAPPVNPFAAFTFTSWAVSLNDALSENDEPTSKVRIRYLFEDAEQVTAAAWIQEQGDLQTGFAGGIALDVKAHQDERAFVIDAVVPDDRVEELILGN